MKAFSICCLAEDLPGLEMPWVCCWALHNVGAILDAAGMWLDDGERLALVELRSGS